MWVEPVVAPLTTDHSTRLRLPANAEDLLVVRFDGWLQEDAVRADCTWVDYDSPCNVLATRDLNLGSRNSHFCSGKHTLHLKLFICLAGLRTARLAISCKISGLAPLLWGSFLIDPMWRLDRDWYCACRKCNIKTIWLSNCTGCWHRHLWLDCYTWGSCWVLRGMSRSRLAVLLLRHDAVVDKVVIFGLWTRNKQLDGVAKAVRVKRKQKIS